MKRTRIGLLFLCLTLLLSLALPFATAVAEEEKSEADALQVSKTATYNEEDDSYTITLEAFATGEKIIHTETKDVPTDIILVLDLSSSMTEDIGTASYSAYSNKNNEALYALRHNGGEGNLWYQNGDSYYSVSVTAEGRTANYDPASSYSNSSLYTNRNNLYAKIGEEYVKVTVDRSGRNDYTYTYTYTYTYNASTVTKTSSGSNNKPSFDTGVTLQVLESVDTTSAKYTYTYTDSTGTKTIATSTGGTSTPTGVTFYSRSTSTSGGGSRLAALKNACNTFAEEVAKKAKGADKTAETTDDVKHRIAIVGFNSSSKRYTGTSDATVLIDMNTSTGENTVKTAITNLNTSQGTVPATGLSTANDIFAANSISAGETRNRVVIFFTDGYPSTSGSNNFNYTYAGAAISEAQTAKNTYKAYVYSIAVIAGADPTQAGENPGEDLSPGTPAACNWYLQNVSSNNGTPQSPSYYLSASDADSLKNIFQQISEQIETGGSDSKLTKDAVVRDIISPQFTLPEGATKDSITLKTYKYNGPSFDAANAWTENDGDVMGASATVDGDKVSVTGFDFSENWCGTESTTGTLDDKVYRGNKLVISFTVKPQTGFLGGNDVPTNTGAGIYENAKAGNPVKQFAQPTVNVPIQNVTVTAEDKNVYLLDGVTAAELQSGATGKVGDDVELNLSKAENNYGLADWQTAYVNISHKITDKDGNPVTDLTNLTDDTTYTVEVTVAPKTGGEQSSGTKAETSKGIGTGNINVFKPEITFQDSQIDLGERADYEKNKVATDFVVWKHETITADTATMGEAPALAYTYEPGEAAFTQDTPVEVTVKMGTDEPALDISRYVTFYREKCEYSGCDNHEKTKVDTDTTTGNRVNFIVHVVTFDLKIEKTGCANIDENQSFLFTVTGDDKTLEVVIHGTGSATINGLKPGVDYTVTENIKWSWRYTPTTNPQTVNTTAQPAVDGVVTVTFNNTRSKDKWLDGNAYCDNKWINSSTDKAPTGN